MVNQLYYPTTRQSPSLFRVLLFFTWFTYYVVQSAQKCDETNGEQVCLAGGDSDGIENPNENDKCDQWAKAGECTKNPTFMNDECADSCDRVFQASIEEFDKDQCQLYLAESSIPNAGLGLYTAIPVKANTKISYPEIVVNSFDLANHVLLGRLKKEQEGKTQYESDFSDSVPECPSWARAGECDKNPNYMLKYCSQSCDVAKRVDTNTSCPSWASQGECESNPDYMLENCSRSCNLISKTNKIWWLPENYIWHARNTHSLFEAETLASLVPGFGMLTNCQLGLVNTYLRRPTIDAAGLHRGTDPGVGAFSNFYGVSYLADRNIPGGMEIFSGYGDNWFTEKEHLFGPIPLSDDYRNADAILEKLTKKMYEKDDAFVRNLLSFIKDDLISRENLRMVIPSDVDNAKDASIKGTALFSLPNAIRSNEWLVQNGQCLDNIKPLTSTIPQAGRGAFATRHMKKGDIAAPAPMVHIRRSDLHMYKENPDGRIDHVGEQMILNYSYGHSESSLLLFPYTPITNFINHNSDKSKVNVKIQWSSIANHHGDWLDLSPEEVLSHTAAGLVMEFVAMRDIDEGEEIFVDYGDSWQEAWDNHVEKWEPLDGVEDFVSAEDLNMKEDDIRTESEQRAEPYPRNVSTVCFIPHDLLLNYKKGTSFIWYEHQHMYRFMDRSRECTILSRSHSHDTGEKVYKAKVKLENRKYLVVESIARHAIEFVNKPYTSDQHIINAFRHEIEIPGDIFPSKWKDLKPDWGQFDPTAHWHKEIHKVPYDQCRFYMAESSIPGAGLSMYAGKDIKEGSYTQPELAIHILDFPQQVKLRCERNENDCEKKWWLPKNYEWTGAITFGVEDAKESSAMISGIGALGNYHTGLFRAQIVYPEKKNAGLHRAKDPAAGAISSYDNAKFMFTDSVPEGMEIFISYGENWLLHRKEKFGDVPLSEDFRKSDNLALAFHHLSYETGLNDDMKRNVLEFVRNDLVQNRRTRASIPETIEGVEEVNNIGSALKSVPDVVKTIDWLKQNGRCLDEIEQGKSTIEGAGRGAFARRDILKGEIIAPAPVLQLDRSIAELLEKGEDDEIRKVGDQLILNYSYGHKNSSVLLFPYSPVTNMINHNTADAVNAKLQWSSMSFHNSTWTELSAEEVLSKRYSGLILEFVATKDIKTGEEIFIDYGPAWAEAWGHHVENWKPVRGAQHYLSSWHFNSMDIIPSKPLPGNIKALLFLPKRYFDKAERRGRTLAWYAENDQMEYRKSFYCKNIKKETGGLYNAEVEHDDEILVITQIPRKYIHFIDYRYTTDESVGGVFRHEIHLPDDLFPSSWMDR